MIGLIKDRLAAKTQSTGKNFITDVTLESFTADVLEASAMHVILVDFWAPWCGPCQQLTPLLERLVQQHQESVRLAKVNADEQPQLTAYLRIQSLPTVYAFVKGQPVDVFTGILPEEKLKLFLNKVLTKADFIPQTSDFTKLFDQAESSFCQQDYNQALLLYQQILKQDPGNQKSLTGLARSYLMLGQLQLAQEIAKQLPFDAENTPENEALKTHFALLALQTQTPPLADNLLEIVKQCEKGEFKVAITNLLAMVAKAPVQSSTLAKDILLKVFTTLGYNHILAQEGRRQLSTILFS